MDTRSLDNGSFEKITDIESLSLECLSGLGPRVPVSVTNNM